MSKSKKNFPDPMQIVEKYGADALRLYLINSPVVRGENLRFQEDGVAEVIKHVLNPWFNSYKFVSQAVNKYESVSSFIIPYSFLSIFIYLHIFLGW